MMVAQDGHLAVTQCLLEHGVDVDKARDDGWTPLHIACHEGHVEVVTCLMNWGASLIVRTHDEDDLAAAGAAAGDGGHHGNDGELPIDVTDNEVIKQLIRDEEKRRRDHGFKRAVIPFPTAAEEEQIKRQRLEVESEGESQGQGQASASAVAEGGDQGIHHVEMSSQTRVGQVDHAMTMTMMNSMMEEEEGEEDDDDNSESSDEEQEKK